VRVLVNINFYTNRVMVSCNRRYPILNPVTCKNGHGGVTGCPYFPAFVLLCHTGTACVVGRVLVVAASHVVFTFPFGLGCIVVLGRVAGLEQIDEAGDVLVVGARVTNADLAANPLVRRWCAPLAIAVGGLGDPQVRNRGTVGGALAFANPGADEPTALAALAAEVVPTSASGKRRVPVGEFLRGARSTVRRPDEFVSAIRVSALT
jgi:FAD binding domain in molybdopterin dehydrogenase